MWSRSAVCLVCCCLAVASGASNSFDRNYRTYGVVPAQAYAAPINYEGYENQADLEPQAPAAFPEVPVHAPALAPALRPSIQTVVRPAQAATGGYAASRPAAHTVFLRPAAPTSYHSYGRPAAPSHASSLHGYGQGAAHSHSSSLSGYGQPASPSHTSAHQAPTAITYSAPLTIYRPATFNPTPYNAPVNPIQSYGNIRLNAASQHQQHQASNSQQSHQHQASPVVAYKSQVTPQRSTIAAPACPQNYLFSCQPSLVPVPCSAGQTTAY